MTPIKCQNNELLSALKGAGSILICTHVAPDGDAIGSTLALGVALQGMGKRVTMACQDAPPAYLGFLPGISQLVRADALEGMSFDLALALDVGDEDRMGECFAAFSRAPVRAQVDHHATNPRYAPINEVDDQTAATGNLIFRILRALDAPLTRDMAICLYTAINSDTGNFCFDNATDECFENAAVCVRAGIPVNDIARALVLERPREHVALLARALGSLRFLEDGRMTGMTLTLADYEACGARKEHSDKIINYGLYIPGVRMNYMLEEAQDGVRCGFRALPPCNVGEIARKLGGGGHVLASGCMLRMPLEAARRAVEDAMRAHLAALDGRAE